MSPELDRGLCADLSDSVVAEGRKEIFRIVANEVPARKLKATNLSQHFFSIHRLEVFLLGLVRRESKRHLPFDHRDPSVSQADLIAGIDDGSIADSRSVGQSPGRHIGCEPDGGIEAARSVVLKPPIPRLVLPCAAATPARESEKISAAINPAKNEAVVEWLSI
jgi:hypothetical protein